MEAAQKSIRWKTVSLRLAPKEHRQYRLRPDSHWHIQCWSRPSTV